MNRGEAIDLIAQRLGNRGTSLDTQIALELQQAQREMEALPELPWFLSVKNTSLSTTASTRTVTLPSTFLFEDEDEGFLITDSNGKKHELRKANYLDGSLADYLTNDDEGDAKGLPEQYSIHAQILYLFPTPDKAYTLELNYYATDTTLSTDAIENDWLLYASDVLIARAGLQMSRFLRDPELVQLFGADLSTAVRRMVDQSTARRMAGRVSQMGG